MSYRLTPQALQDLTDIADFLIQEYPHLAPTVELELRRIFDLVTEFPGIGRIGLRPGTRELPLQKYPYVVIYRNMSDRTDILRVYHMARDPKRKLGRKT